MEVGASFPLGDRQPTGHQVAEMPSAHLERSGWADVRRYGPSGAALNGRRAPEPQLSPLQL